MIDLFFFETEAEAIAAAHALEKLGGRAKKILSECIQHQIITRKSVSETARTLESEGFIFIKEFDGLFDKSFEIRPSLFGEEAMDIDLLIHNHD
ncbi:hypothetical protein A1507_17695 [Methylomonas koyamae]|uniref:MarR family transcriptional regulator n=1 Tax=Methylomonas koyamae TaxID=702114 RepID=A0A177N5M5_9GAMM|nr:hypothetical protein [Methylomonas koyamae]OAI13202.1 hypothetical protein A1507_17695 [Methylomonas koyamae]